MVRPIGGAVLLCALFLSSGASRGNPLKDEFDLAGQWVVAVQQNGKTTRKGNLARVKIKGRSIRVEELLKAKGAKPRTVKGTFAILEDVPGGMDLTLTLFGETKARIVKALYLLKEDTVTISFRTDGGPRPAKVEAGPNQVMLTLKRLPSCGCLPPEEDE